MRNAALVAGGASGIGLAVAVRLREDGWPVAIIDTDANALARAEDAIDDADVLLIRADVTDEDEIDAAFDQAADALGPVGALINCAGLSADQPLAETTAETLRQVLDVNVVGAFIAARAALERMGDELAIVNLVSVSGLRANAGHGAFGAAKAAVKALSEAMAVELAARKVRVNCVAAGPVDNLAPGRDAPRRAAWTGRVPQRRCGEPEEVAAAVAFLVSPEAGYITGHTLAVDGGFLAAGLMPE